ncbi:MAG: T9SS type A sorting domain-containing protein, partial [Ignavibacteriaceae bacterium]|nr:T9SS type A sorting domain-containing protein [Ignavibacteriaceae bacterium]
VMKNFSRISFMLLFSMLITGVLFGQAFVRVGEIPLPAPENASFGNIVAGVDLDGDGLMEIYAVNNNWNDSGAELIPSIFKFEYKGLFAGWQLVWRASIGSIIPLQNTWPALAVGDLDKDGRQELIWTPVNYSPYTADMIRVVVFEVAGDGSDNLGVPDAGTPGNWLPNAKWSIDPAADVNLRPFRAIVADPDGDNVNELLFCTRAGGFNFGVASVSNIPNNGDGSETWTLEYSGGTGTAYDLAVKGNDAFVINTNGDVLPFTYTAGAWVAAPPMVGLIPGGSWHSAATVDINNDNTKEIIVAGNGSAAQKFFLLQGSGAAVTATEIGTVTTIGLSGRMYGGSAGDIDVDGKVDFVAGTRSATPNESIIRFEYNGTGAITDPVNYTITTIDKEFTASIDGRWMHIAVANVDEDPDMEVLYSEGTGELAPIVILDHNGHVPVELSSFSANVVDGLVRLDWATTTETNNYGFEVQRSVDGKSFATVAFVNGAGTSTEKHTYSYVDSDVEIGNYFYRLKQVDLNGTFAYTDVTEVNFTTPTEFVLEQNYPNPFNPSTTIKFGLAANSAVDLRVYNIVGEEVAVLVSGQMMESGTYQVTFNANNLPSGTYIYRLSAGNKVLTNKMTLLK